MRTFRNIRIAILLLVLVLVGARAMMDARAIRGWDEPVLVMLFPVAIDTDPTTTTYTARLDSSAFSEIDSFVRAQASAYGIQRAQMLEVEVGPSPAGVPPLPPDEPSILDVILFSLKLRWWTWRHAKGEEGHRGDVRLFVLYYAPVEGRALPHSIGLESGHVGIVHAFAGNSLSRRNNVVIAHELLHTAGATDKYGPDGVPVYPDGYADPTRPQNAPQNRAEIMAGLIPLGPDGFKDADSLSDCAVGPVTAREIGWTQ